MVQSGLSDNIIGTVSAIQIDEPLPLEGVERDIIVAAIKVWSSVLESDEGLDALLNGAGLTNFF
jgi:hypothetical protein